MFKKISLAATALTLIIGGVSQVGIKTADLKEAFDYVCCGHDGAGLSN